MICIYSSDATDFTGIGEGVLDPVTCTVNDTGNGMWQLNMMHLYGDRCDMIEPEKIIVADVPCPPAPGLAADTGRRMHIASANTVLHADASEDAAKLAILFRGKKCISCDYVEDAVWTRVCAADGTSGYVHTSAIDEGTTLDATGVRKFIAQMPQCRRQPFRIYRVEPTSDGLNVTAMHLYYDLARRPILTYAPQNQSLGTVLPSLPEEAEGDNLFTLRTDLTDSISADFRGMAVTEAISGSSGVLSGTTAYMTRDWMDVYIMAASGENRGVAARYGHNITELEGYIDDSNVATRLIPKGTAKSGNPLYLPEVYVESPYASLYQKPIYAVLECNDAVESADVSKTQCYTMMRKAAQEAYTAGRDLPELSLTVDMVDLKNSTKGHLYEKLANLWLWDDVQTYVGVAKITTTVKLSAYEWDCLARKYISMTLGSVPGSLATLNASMRALARRTDAIVSEIAKDEHTEPVSTSVDATAFHWSSNATIWNEVSSGTALRAGVMGTYTLRARFTFEHLDLSNVSQVKLRFTRADTGSAAPMKLYLTNSPTEMLGGTALKSTTIPVGQGREYGWDITTLAKMISEYHGNWYVIITGSGYMTIDTAAGSAPRIVYV